MSADEPKRHAPKGRIKANADPTAPPNLMASGSQRCSARSKTTGNQCLRPAIRGGTVCRYHGGAAPQVMAKAEERLKALIHPAITKLGKLIEQDQFPSVSYQAVRDALDRDGKLGKPKESQDVDLKHEIVIRWQ